MAAAFGRHIWLGTAVSAFALLSAGAAHAQTSSPAPTDDQATPAPTAAPGEIVVTAQRRSESIQDVPIAIQAFGNEELADRGVHNVQDLAQFTPNVNISSPFGPGSQPNIVIRGIGLNDFNTNNAGPNGVYSDEFYISSPNAQGLSLFDLERVEVLKGPQGTLYGRNTSGGAINYISAKPTQEFQARFHGEYGSFNTVYLEGAVGGGLTDTLSARVAGTYNYSEGYLRNLLLDRRENGANQFALRGQLLWEPTSDLRVLLKVQYSKADSNPTRYRLVGSLNPDPFDPVAVLLGMPDKCSVERTYAGECVDLFGNPTLPDFYSGNWTDRGKTRVRDFLTTARIDYTAGPVTFTSLSGYNYDRRFFPDDTDAAASRILEIDWVAKSREFTQELRAAQSEANYNWVLGLYFLNEHLTQDQPLYLYRDIDLLFGAPGAGDGIAQIFSSFNRQNTRSYAAFGQLEYEVVPDLRLVAGARYTWDRKSFAANSSFRFQEGGMDNFGPEVGQASFADVLREKKFNWRLGMNYQAAPDVLLYANVATGYKGGGFNGGFIVSDETVRDAALAAVKGETVTSYEVGLKSEFLNRAVTFNLAGFYNDYKNQQVLVQVLRDNVIVFTLDNAKKARTYGVDADLTVRPTEHLSLSAQLGLLNTKLVDFVPTRDPSTPDYSGNRLTYAPKTSLSLAADYVFPFDTAELSFHYDTNYRSRQFFDSSNSPYLASPGYWLHNARIGLSFGDDRYELGVFGRNLTKKQYILLSTDLTLTSGSIQQVYGMPRVFGVDFSAKY